jgi:hypothetical protein
MWEFIIEKSFNIILLLLGLAVGGEQLDEFVIDAATHLQDNGVAAEFRNGHIYLTDHLALLRPEIPVDGQQSDTAGDAGDVAVDTHFLLQLLIVDVLDDHGGLGTDVVVGAEGGGELVDPALALRQVHAGLLDHLLTTPLLPLYNHVMVGPDQQGQLEVLGLLPFGHDEEVVLSLGEGGGEGDALAVAVSSFYPTVAVKLALHQHHPHPHVLVVEGALHEEPALLLLEGDEAVAGLGED